MASEKTVPRRFGPNGPKRSRLASRKLIAEVGSDG
jgi:hypothetical protein